MKGLVKLRKKAKLTQCELAELLNVRQSSVAMWESGEVMPTADKLPKIAKILNCKIDDLYRGGEGDEKK